MQLSEAGAAAVACAATASQQQQGKRAEWRGRLGRGGRRVG